MGHALVSLVVRVSVVAQWVLVVGLKRVEWGIKLLVWSVVMLDSLWEKHSAGSVKFDLLLSDSPLLDLVLVTCPEQLGVPKWNSAGWEEIDGFFLLEQDVPIFEILSRLGSADTVGFSDCAVTGEESSQSLVVEVHRQSLDVDSAPSGFVDIVVEFFLGHVLGDFNVVSVDNLRVLENSLHHLLTGTL